MKLTSEKSNQKVILMFVFVVNVDDVEEVSTNDEGEDGLDLSNMFDKIPPDTNEVIETIDILQQHLFSLITPSPVPSPKSQNANQNDNQKGTNQKDN